MCDARARASDEAPWMRSSVVPYFRVYRV
jgi:hypothetical protein